MALNSRIILLIFLSWCISSGISAEETLNETSAESDMLEFTLPEITVMGHTSISSLEREVIKAEELKFEVFNNLNSTDEFDITCEWSAPLGTRIKKWSCDVEYIRRARSDDARDLMQLGTQVRSDNQLALEYADKTRALNREMKSLAVQYPELAVAMINAYELEQFYKKERRKRFKDSILVGDLPEPDLKLNKIVIWEAAFQDHRNGLISDEIWERWESLYRKIFSLSSYRALWKSTDHKKYTDEFVTYVNTILSGE